MKSVSYTHLDVYKRQVVRQKSGDLYGILNGIDYNEYNPETDNEIFSKYNKYSFIENKLYNKRGLQHELGLEQNRCV